MQGKVTIYDTKTKQGHIQANDGNIYSFDALAFTNKNDESLIKEGMSCTFEIIDNKVSNFCLNDAEDFIFRNETFKEPESFELISGDLPANYTLIDKAKVSIAKTDRVREKAIYKLKHDCKILGANIVLDVKESTNIRSAMGYGFKFYTIEGVPATVGIVDPKGTVSRDDLEHRLHHKEIMKQKNNAETIKIANLALRICGVILFIIFLLGFIFTL